MSRNREEQARLEGMAYALRYAKEHGIEAQEADLKRRGAYGIPLSVDQASLTRFSENVKHQTFDTIKALTIVTLHDEFGFGRERCLRFMTRLEKKAECISDDYTTWKDQLEIIREELGIPLEIRMNDKNVRIR